MEKKINAKIDQKFDASWDRFLEGFGRFLGAKMNHVGTQIDQKLMCFAKSGFSKNRCFSFGKTTIFKVRGVQIGSKNRSKIDQKMESKMDCILASIFERF